MITVAAPCYAAGVIARYRRHRLDFLAMRSAKRKNGVLGEALWQVPGGSEKPIDNGNPLKVFAREIEEETNLIFKFDHASDARVLHQDEFDHTRYFYFAPKTLFTGILRDYVKEDENSKLFVPEWRSYEFLARNLRMSQQVLVPHLREIKQEWLRRR